MSGKDVLTDLKRFEYFPLGKEVKAQVDIAKTQYQGVNKFFKSDEKEEPTFEKYNKPNITYSSK